MRPSAILRGDWAAYDLDVAVFLAATRAPAPARSVGALAAVAPTVRGANPHHLPGGSAGDPARP